MVIIANVWYSFSVVNILFLNKKVSYFIGAFTYILATLLSGFLLYTTPVSANDDDKLCVPPLNELNNDLSPERGTNENGDFKAENFSPDGWLTVEIVNRSTFKVYMSSTQGTCVKPEGKNLSLSAITEDEGPNSFPPLIDAVLIDNNLDNDFDYRRSDSNNSDDHRIDEIFFPDSARIDGKRIGSLSSTQINETLRRAEIILGIEEDAIPSAKCDGTNSNFFLRISDKEPRWDCSGSLNGDWKGIVIGANTGYSIVNPEKFNIVYVSSEDGRTLNHVSERNQGNDNFVWCDATADNPRFIAGSCSGGNIAIENLTPEDLVTRASDELIEAEIVDVNSGQRLGTTYISGYATESNEYVFESGTLDAGRSCESEGGEFSFIVCPLLRIANSAFTTLDSWIVRSLDVNESYFRQQDGDDGIRAAWSNIRNIAFILLVVVMLIMVIGTALDLNFLDAYTVRRAMPRLLLAIIFIALSFDITAELVEISNTVGRGTAGLIAQPFGGLNNLQLTDIFAASGSEDAIAIGGVAGVLVLGAVGVVSISIILSFLGVAVATLLIIFILLAVRELLIIFLMVVAPLAIIAWIFPGSDKPWKLWRGTFVNLLLLYPLVMAFLAIGRSFAKIADATDADGVFITVIKLVAFIAPYFLIPAAFRYLGGFFANLAGQVNDRSKGLFDRQRKFRADTRKKNLEKAQSSNRFGNTPGLRRLNRSIAYGTNQAAGGLSLLPSTRHAKVTSAMADKEFEHAMESSEKLPGARAFFANDDLMVGALMGGGDRQRTIAAYKSLGQSDDQAKLSTERALRMRNDMGADAFAIAALSKLPATGTYLGKDEDEVAAWHKDIARYTHGDTSLQGSIVAAGKSGWRNAQRYEVSEASFGNHLAAIKMASEAKDANELRKVSEFIVDDAYRGGGPAAVIGSRNDKVARRFSGAMNRSIAKAEQQIIDAETSVSQAEEAYKANPTASNQQAILDAVQQKTNATNELFRAKAAIGAVHDQIGQAKQNVSEVLGNEVYRKPVTVKVIERRKVDSGNVNAATGEPIMVTQEVEVERQVTRLEELQSLASDPRWQVTKHEFQNTVSELERRQAEGLAGGAGNPGQGFEPPRPGGGLPGGL